MEQLDLFATCAPVDLESSEREKEEERRSSPGVLPEQNDQAPADTVLSDNEQIW